MVQNLPRPVSGTFPATAPAAYPVFYRTYSRRNEEGTRESWLEVSQRTLTGLQELGQLTDAEVALIAQMQQELKALTSGRWLWVGGTDWVKKPENFSGGYNCTSTNVVDWRAFGLMMDLAMQGCGTGAVLEDKYIQQLPAIRNPITVAVIGDIGKTPAAERHELTQVEINGNQVNVKVGDSRQGWVKSYQILLETSTNPQFTGPVHFVVDISDIRPTGESLKGFGGVANPVKLPEMYQRCANILNKAVGRQLNSVESCLLIDEAAVVVVAGNVRRSAGMRQGGNNDPEFTAAKQNLWQQDENGNWRIDPERDSLRMANHTRVFHRKPNLEETTAAVRQQYYSGEGAIQWAGEAVARANADLLTTPELKKAFIQAYDQGQAKEFLKNLAPDQAPQELEHRIGRYGLNPCVTAETWIHTGEGPRQVKDLIGHQHSTYVNGELFSTTPDGFFLTGIKPVVKLQTKAGFSLRLTPNHQVLKVTAQTQKKQYSEWVEVGELQPGDRILLHNHREIQPWDGDGTRAEGWLLGSLLGDGSLAKTQWHDVGILHYWQGSRLEMSNYARELLTASVGYETRVTVAHEHKTLNHRVINSTGLAQLAAKFGLKPVHKTITPAIEQASYEFYQGFLQGLFDADGSVQGSQVKGVSVRLAQSNLETLQAVQRMLARLGIIATIYQNRRPEGLRLLPNSQRQTSLYHCQAQHELVISQDNLPHFQELIGFQEPAKQAKLQQLLSGYQRQLNRERFAVVVEAVIPDGEAPVYDCSVPGPNRFDANGLVAHNCGEIIGADFHCVAGQTLLITRDGMYPIQNLVGQSVEIWNGQRWSSVTPFLTGQDRQLYRVKFSDGTFLDVTEKHRFFAKHRFAQDYEELTTLELAEKVKISPYKLHTEPFKIAYDTGRFVEPTWAYTLGQLVGDGSVCQSHGKPQLQLRLYGHKRHQELAIAGRTTGEKRYYTESKEVPCLLYTGFQNQFDPGQVRALKDTAAAFDPIASWDRESILSFIAGLADADGSEVPSGGIRIYISDYDRAYRVYLLLLKCGIRSSVNLVQKAETKTNLGVRKKDLWYLQVTDCAAIPCQRLNTSRGHQPKAKGKHQVIQSVELLPGRHDTFCFNEPEFHKGVFGGTLTGQCNLAEVHLNQIAPNDLESQEKAFKAGALSVAALLNHQFQEPRYRYSREIDPIVGVSFTGLFDFFVQALGVEWLNWWTAGRPDTVQGLDFKEQEATYLKRWRDIVHQTVWDYCDRHGLRRPNRCTTVQPAGTKSLLTGASPGWHPPKAQRFIRRITFRKNDPVALACYDYGYNVIPSQSDKDETGNLLNDPFDPRCSEWLVEIPVAVAWADVPGADQIDISQFSALAQFDFYMQVQTHYTRHNTSATIELRENEVEPLAAAIHQAIEQDHGYISAALLARFDDLQTFPRLPFEPIDKARYDTEVVAVRQRRRTEDFYGALQRYTQPAMEAGPAGCDSDKCMMPETKPAN
ncbi:ribonucleoside-triphosphate reductase, adenosylcobalamin-dependent [Synechococcus sp. PCC 6312]|uniref:ribonucleoside-triphosphate reductase, adenosylcobalamin-dependent n=1 Tax=Synechococcus sp. (strain ATCC 27167 / PCC 6312) TaxID=195253 RepID=UPI00029EEF3C|nr:ribonucleoside-triphosphate reductase, adenosylcobalamin-dependent [Synechococcus sp. PCC 6312]AFY60235.1 ribonucleoside-triphosphate reductase, adenosylcobalamin-dependent [Synechococcus sp. PCC 6312]